MSEPALRFEPRVHVVGNPRATLLRDAIGQMRRVLLPATAAPEEDPVLRLMDPAFTAVTWEYEWSHVGLEIPGALHPKQVEALVSPARHRWLWWGNQVGKTTLGAVDLVLLALGRHPVQKWKPPVHCWASALTWELWEKILLPELLTWIPRDRLIDAPPPHRQSTKRDILIRADNGRVSRITGKAAEQGPARYQSARVHRVWLDEEHPEAVYDEMQPRLLRFGGDTLATMTPLKGMTWVHSRVYEPWQQGKLDAAQAYASHAGLTDNPSISREAIEELRRELQHNPAQLAARLYGHFVRPAGLVLPFDPERHFEDLTEAQVANLRVAGSVYGGVDFGLWRFAFTLWIADRAGRLHLIDEVFSQRESMDQRAVRLDKVLRRWQVDPDRFSSFSDCANPQDLLELNLAMERAGSPYRFGAVDAANKIIKAGVERMENLLNRGALLVRRGLGDGQVWRLGMNASKEGKPVEGSRWLWEINNWQYPKTDDGKVQKDEPDDASADGADMMAASRYPIMSWLVPEAPAARRKAPTLLERLKKEMEELDAEATQGHHTYRTLRQ